MSILTKDEILNMIYENPIEVGHWVGFNELNEVNNNWLRQFLFNTEDMTLQGHRGSFKTTTLSLFFVIHTIIRPNETVIMFRKTGTDVTEVIRQTSNIMKAGCIRKIIRILYNKDLVFTKDSENELSTNLATTIKGSSQIVGLGIGTSITGKHADIIITDDIVNVNDRTSKAERERTKRAYMELENIKNRGGRFINTGTPWHKDDAFQLMPKPQKYDCYSTGLMSDEEIKHVKDRMLASLFAANYELRHIASEDVIFTDPVTEGDPALCEHGIAHVDSAFYGEDYTAWCIVKRHADKIYVYGRMRRLHVGECYSLILNDYQRFMCGKLYNEDNADKGFVAKELRGFGIKVVTYTEHQNKYLKIVTHLKAVWNNIVFVKGTDPEFIQQITDYNENADHDDAPDTLASIIRVITRKSQNEEYKPLWN